MATAIIKYRAMDGSEWSSEQAAKQREADIREAEVSLLSLGGEHEIPSGAYVQHTKDAVFKARRLVWQIVCRIYGKSYPKWLEANPDEVSPLSVVGRVLSDGDRSPLGDAWGRLSRINFDNFREYQQVYYARNPNEANREMKP